MPCFDGLYRFLQGTFWSGWKRFLERLRSAGMFQRQFGFPAYAVSTTCNLRSANFSELLIVFRRLFLQWGYSSYIEQNPAVLSKQTLRGNPPGMDAWLYVCAYGCVGLFFLPLCSYLLRWSMTCDPGSYVYYSIIVIVAYYCYYCRLASFHLLWPFYLIAGSVNSSILFLVTFMDIRFCSTHIAVCSFISFRLSFIRLLPL